MDEDCHRIWARAGCREGELTKSGEAVAAGLVSSMIYVSVCIQGSQRDLHRAISLGLIEIVK